MQKLKTMDEIFGKADDAYLNFTSDKEKMYILEAREKFLHDLNSDLGAAYDDGIQKGIREKGLEDAKNFKMLGVSTRIISEATGLSQEEINKL